MAEEQTGRGLPLPALREVRLRALLTQGQLAEQAGVSRQSITRAERGEPVAPATIRRLARALRVAPEILMGPPSGALGEAMIAETRARYQPGGARRARSTGPDEAAGKALGTQAA